MPLEISRVRGLCFDVDGTLHDTDDQFVVKLASWLRSISFLFPHRDPLPFARRVVMATESPANRLYGIPDRLGIDWQLVQLGDLIYRLGLGKDPQPYRLIPGVLEMLQRLSSHFPISVVSARSRRTTHYFLEKYQIHSYFRAIATAQTCRHTKPYPDPILWAANQMGVPPEACLMIGDTIVDLQAGKAAGAQTVGVLCGFGTREELLGNEADLVLSTTADLVDVLLKN